MNGYRNVLIGPLNIDSKQCHQWIWEFLDKMKRNIILSPVLTDSFTRAPERPSHSSPHIPCNWEALEQAHSSRHPWERGKLPGMAQLPWVVLDWVADPYLLLAHLLAPSPSGSSPSLPHPIPSHPIPSHPIPSFSSPLLLVSLQQDYAMISAFFPSVSSSMGDTGEKAGTAASQGKGASCCFLERERK